MAFNRPRTEDEKKRISETMRLRGINKGSMNPMFGKFGNKHHFFGKKHSQKTKDTIIQKKKGCRGPNKGKKFSEEWCKNMSLARIGLMVGPLHPHWNPDRTYRREYHRLHNTYEWKEWRETIFKRDNWTCQECGERGVFLEAHHIIPIRDLFSSLGGIESGSDFMYVVSNGITLCRDCHKRTIKKEHESRDRYFDIITSK